MGRPGGEHGARAPGRLPGDRAQLGLDARRRRAPDEPELERLRAAIDAAQQRSGSSRSSPSTPSAATRRSRRGPRRVRLRMRPRSCAGSRSCATISLGNEPNSNLFWRPQFGRGGTDAAAAAYFRLLADGLPARQGGEPARHRDRRLAGRARRRQPARRAARPTRRPGSSRTSAPRSGRAASASLRSTSSRSTRIPRTRRSRRRRRPALDLDRDRRLPEARRAPDAGLRASRRRSSTASTGSRPRSRAPSSTSTRDARRVDPAGERGAAGRRLRRGDPPGRLPAARADARLLPRHRRVGAHRPADRASTTRTAGPSGASGGSPPGPGRPKTGR